MISISDLGKSFGAQTLFQGGSILFTAGNRYVLVGANGSGKTEAYFEAMSAALDAGGQVLLRLP